MAKTNNRYMGSQQKTSCDFANILFAGPCNLRCPYCIGKQINPQLSQNNLNKFPLCNLNKFVSLLNHHQIAEIVLSGTTTDPQLYRHEAKLLVWLRAQLLLHPTRQRQISLHTNGLLALRKMRVFNQYDRVCISFPSFKVDTYQKMTRSSKIPDLSEILRQARIPVKISAVLTKDNAGEVDSFLDQCGILGINRVVFRCLYEDTREWALLDHLPQISNYRNNPVYDYHGMQVTYWRFQHTRSTSLNLFSNGTISAQYLLAGTKLN